ncbi:MAG: large conductance mechanosensitive channel protein MscL [Croceibacterium sp.]|jgi:large conductance mechanosensitive channel
MWNDFKAFIAKGNVMDLAVGVIIGAGFAAIVASLTGDVIMPIVGWIFGGFDFTSHFVVLHMPADYHGSMADYAALKKAGASLIGYGAFLTAVLNFLILAFVIFLLVRFVKKISEEVERKHEEAPQGPTEVDLLTEIRDELKKRP